MYPVCKGTLTSHFAIIQYVPQEVPSDSMLSNISRNSSCRSNYVGLNQMEEENVKANVILLLDYQLLSLLIYYNRTTDKYTEK